jgi:copper resistance protein B
MRLTLAPLALVILAAPAAAQHAGHDMSAMQPSADPHAGHDMSGAKPAEATDAPAADPHAGHDMSGVKQAEAAAPAGGSGVGTDQEPGSAPAPAPPVASYADRFWSPEAMARARAGLHAEHGAMNFSQIMLNIAEIRPDKGKEGVRWDGEGWFGGDINRLTIKSEGEGRLGDRLESAEVQALYSRAIDAYWNLQAGVRHDFRPNPDRTYATIGIEGLAPYWFEVEGALFLSNKGDLLARAEAYYDQRITNRLVLQPRVELNFAAQDVPETRTGSGLSDAELGLRLRYEFAREFAPYVGVSWERKIGDSARYARADGDERTAAGVVLGVRFWF